MQLVKKQLEVMLIVVVFLLTSTTLQAQDSLFIYKDKKIIAKYSVTQQIDSITFTRTKTVNQPIITAFSFEKENNEQLFEDKKAKIDKTDIKVKLPLTSTLFVPTFQTDKDNIVTVNGQRQQSGVTAIDFSQSVIYKVTTPQGKSQEYTVNVKWKKGLPHITIQTENYQPIVSKENYLRAYLIVDGVGMFENFIDSANVKGRGNTTWHNPKKPYKIKLDSKESVLGLKKAKKWVLLANYIDKTHMLNLFALKAGQLIGLPFTNHAIPVNVTVNGKYMGIYTFTEQVEIKKNRVDIDDKEGVLLEFDRYFDEAFKFKSTYYGLPVMVKDPDLEDETPEKQEQYLKKIEADFTELEEALVSSSFPNNNYKDLIDVESVIKYLIIYNITDNRELNHPKSTYMHKDKGGKYFMGPIWDFDWAYSYEGNYQHFVEYNMPLLRKLSSSSKGTAFFQRFLDDPNNKILYKQIWTTFKTQELPKLLKYIDAMETNIEKSQSKDYQTWGQGTAHYANKIDEFKEWLINRANYIDAEISNW